MIESVNAVDLNEVEGNGTPKQAKEVSDDVANANDSELNEPSYEGAKNEVDSAEADDGRSDGVDDNTGDEVPRSVSDQPLALPEELGVDDVAEAEASSDLQTDGESPSNENDTELVLPEDDEPEDADDHALVMDAPDSKFDPYKDAAVTDTELPDREKAESTNAVELPDGGEAESSNENDVQGGNEAGLDDTKDQQDDDGETDPDFWREPNGQKILELAGKGVGMYLAAAGLKDPTGTVGEVLSNTFKTLGPIVMDMGPVLAENMHDQFDTPGDKFMSEFFMRDKDGNPITPEQAREISLYELSEE